MVGGDFVYFSICLLNWGSERGNESEAIYRTTLLNKEKGKKILLSHFTHLLTVIASCGWIMTLFNNSPKNMLTV